MMLQVQALEARGPDDFERAFTAMTRERAGAALILTDGMFGLHRTRIADLAVKSRLATMHRSRAMVDGAGSRCPTPRVNGPGLALLAPAAERARWASQKPNGDDELE